MVGITGSAYHPLDNEFQIREAAQQMVETVNSIKHPLGKALTFILLLSYIQPFEDGNKRTARLTGNAILLANNYCPFLIEALMRQNIKKQSYFFTKKTVPGCSRSYLQINLSCSEKLFSSVG